MTKDVLITVKGMQAIDAGEKPEEVEVVAKGDYYYRNDHHEEYDQGHEGFCGSTENRTRQHTHGL